MYERTIQYLPLHLHNNIHFLLCQFTVSVHTNLTVTDHFGSTIKTNEGHMHDWHIKDYYLTHMHRDMILYNLTQTSIKNTLFSEKRLYAPECLINNSTCGQYLFMKLVLLYSAHICRAFIPY